MQGSSITCPGLQFDASALKLLRTLAAHGEGAIVPQDALLGRSAGAHTLDLLMRRELIEMVEGGYHFQVELIRRWFAQEGAMQTT